MLNSGFQAYQSGDAARAEQISRQVLQAQPDNEGALLLLALCLDAQTRSFEANATFERIVELYPASPEHWVNLGNMRRTLGYQSGARDAYTQALALEPAQTDALQNLGLIQFENGLFPAARKFLIDALASAPHDAAIRCQAATACYEAGEPERAQELAAGWETWASADPIVTADLAWLFAQLGDTGTAERAMSLAEKREPGNIRVLARRAAFCERTNRVDEARVLLSRIARDEAAAAGLSEDVEVVRALLATRGDDLADACRLHEAILSDPAAGNRHPHLYYSLARLYDRLDQPQQAMQWLQQGHALQLRQLQQQAPELLASDADPMDITRQRLTAADVAGWLPDSAPAAQASPIFVLGFPRSGTTMLETMLDANPALTSMDERAFLQDVIHAMRQKGLRYPHDLGKLDHASCAQLRDQYWALVKSHSPADPSKRLVDKNPLNMLRLPLIKRLFPNAKIILALRDPGDVVLSNYMQMFRTPAYVTMCASLASTAQGYASAFDFWNDQVEVLKPDVLTLRHEDTVEDVEGCSRRICEFLQIEWTSRMVDFHQHALERGYISTPSYHQVVEPVNKKGIGRWHKYAEWMAETNDAIAPFARQFGYRV